jgi:hypothetical protein
MDIREDFCKFIVDAEGRPVRYYTKHVPIERIVADLRGLI